MIAQGATESERIGRKCTIKAINWRYDVSIPESVDAATPVNGDVVRVIVYLDKQCNGATAAVTDIVETANYQTFNNLANKSRFRILMDAQHTLNPLTLTSTQNADTFDSCEVRQSGTFFKKCHIPLEFDGVTGAITEIRSNNVGVLLLGKTGVATFASKMRIRFEG